MDSNYFTSPLEFLINTLFSLFITAVMLRFLLAWVRADFYNPLSQILVKITNPALKPMRRLIPGLGGIDIASVLLMLILQMLALGLITLLRGASVHPLGLLLWAIAELLGLLINIYMFSILIQVILSWISPGTYNPVAGLIFSINEPLLAPARRLIPPLSGLDLSPLAVMVGLQLAKMLLLPPLLTLGVAIS